MEGTTTITIMMMMFHELRRKSMMMRLHMCCSMYGNDEIYINNAMTVIYHHKVVQMIYG